MDQSELERTLLMVREVLVYKLPPRPGASGYRCQEWPKQSCIFQGRLRVIATGAKCVILLESAETNQLYAQCPLDNDKPEVSVEPVTDSSRYFVIRVDDGRGRHAFLGLGFRERADAFDFNVALQDHVRQARGDANGGAYGIDAHGDTGAAGAAAQPLVDFSLKEGETLTVSIGGRTGGARKREPAAAGAATAAGMLGPLPPPPVSLAMPPGPAGARRRPSAGADAAPNCGSADLLGGGGSFGDGGGFGGGFGSGAFGGDGDGFGGADAHGKQAGDSGGGWTTFG
ncbi:hypothetical protein KFE25_011145 [Diacronema lutheri]|uniref:NECAP PHear domain-containing protein n=1 Tax=Diacronema lutheri TaxID=2081491 RepID=A0A8J6CD41_DIALT|nr:hypothetical protein KFE25_011145 [Diacronema lutheri]